MRLRRFTDKAKTFGADKECGTTLPSDIVISKAVTGFTLLHLPRGGSISQLQEGSFMHFVTKGRRRGIQRRRLE